METLIQQFINGLVIGSVYALIALGYTMVYGILGLINFAHGDVLMVGALVALQTMLFLMGMAPGMSPLVMLAIALGGSVLFALYTITVRDAYPITPGHTLVIPVRHFASFFDATPPERDAMLSLLHEARQQLQVEFGPAGCNIGINDGTFPGLHFSCWQFHHSVRQVIQARSPIKT